MKRAERHWVSLINGALIALGTLAVVDNVLVHWVLGWHRLKEGWDANVYAEVFLVVLGTVMVAVGIRAERQARRRTGGRQS